MFNVAIDGTTSSGKSTLAQNLSKALSFKRLDTGAIYRGIACRFKRLKMRKVSEKNIEKLVSDLSIRITFKNEKQHVIVNGIDETDNLRTEQISLLTSEISPYKVVRDKVLAIQRKFAAKHDCVMEGRDITTVVLPHADVKFYITASPEERARRRWLQFVGKKDAPTYEDVLEDLKIRDDRDSHREFGKLAIAEDAIVIDTTEKTLDEVTKMCEEIVRSKMN